MKKYLILLVVALAKFNLFSTPAIPTFDYSNLLAAIESTYRAIEFYENSMKKADEYISKIKELANAIDKGDRDEIIKGIKNVSSDSVKIINEIEKIIKDIKTKKYEAEVSSKESVLKILNVLTNPSIKNIKDYLDDKKYETNVLERVAQIAKDAKEAASIALFDYSKSADEAIKRLDNKYLDLARGVSQSIANISDKENKYSSNLTAQQSLGIYVHQINDAKVIIEDTKKEINFLKEQIENDKYELEDNLASWANIANKSKIYLEENINLKRNAFDLQNYVKNILEHD